MSTVEITHPDKLLFPGDGISKADLASYYERVSEWMLPHISFRPVSMQRFPDGIEGKGFFHKDVPDYFPAWVRRVEVPKSGGTVTHVYVCDSDALVYRRARQGIQGAGLRGSLHRRRHNGLDPGRRVPGAARPRRIRHGRSSDRVQEFRTRDRHALED